MKRSRYIIAVLIGIILAAALGGCGSGSSDAENALKQGIREIIEEGDFSEKSFDEKGKAIEEYLHRAAADGVENADGNTVVEDSIEYDEGSHTCIYTDSEGGLNIVDFGEKDQYVITDDSQEPDLQGNVPEGIEAEGILLYGIDAPNSDNAEDYKAMAATMKEQGLSCEIDTDMTVEDYKTELADQDFVIIETHGSTLNYGYGFRNMSSAQAPVLCTREDITAKNLAAYREDIAEQRIAKVTVIEGESATGLADRYWIMPSFFEKYYGNNQLEDTYVHMGNCCGFGCSAARTDGSLDYALAQTFIDCGADAVTGYYNSVFTYYDYNMIGDIMAFLADGSTLSDAVNLAKSYNGEDDKAYAQRVGWLTPGNPCYNSAKAKIDEGIAYINLIGSGDLKFDAEETQAESEPETEAQTESHTLTGVWKNGESEKLILREDGTGYWSDHLGAYEFTYTADGDTVTFTLINPGEAEAANFSGELKGDQLFVTDHHQQEKVFTYSAEDAESL